MDDTAKTTMTHYDDFPLVPAIVVDGDEEPFGAFRTDFVVIDGHFENTRNVSDLLSESNNSAVSIALDSDSYRSHSLQEEDHQNRLEEEFDTTHIRHSKVDPSKTIGAWAAGIVLGFAMGVGPSLSMAFGIGAAYYSSQEEGVAGDVARAFGDVALLSHAKMVQVDEKHKIVDTVAKCAVAFSRNCLNFTIKYTGKLFSNTDQNTKSSTRQTSTSNKTKST